MSELLQTLQSQHRELLKHYPVRSAINALDVIPPSASYHHISPTVSRLWTDVREHFGDDGFDAFQRMTMLELIGAFDQRASTKKYSASIVERFDISLNRITRCIEDADYAEYRTRSDLLLKDLAICRQSVFPAGGARIVEPCAGFPRALLVRGGLGQGLRLLSLMARLGGHRPFYSHHTHLSELDEFNADDFLRCNLRLADMLERHPEVKGTHCGSWMYDPALERVSPGLAYMRKIQQDNGALVLFAEISIDGGALAKSKTRKTLFEQGEYIPRSYHVIWPRRQLLAWAAAHRKRDSADTV